MGENYGKLQIFLPDVQGARVSDTVMLSCKGMAVGSIEICGVGQVSFSSCSIGKSSGKLSSISCLLEKDIPTFILFLGSLHLMVLVLQ